MSCQTRLDIVVVFVDESEEFTSQKSVWKTVRGAAKKLGSLFWTTESPASKLTFHICALDKGTIASAKQSLRARLGELVNTLDIRNDRVATLSSQDEMNIIALRSADVGIEIGRFAFTSVVYCCLKCYFR